MMLQSIDDDEKQCVNNPYALKGQQEQWFLTEHGMYEVLMLSRKPIAKQVKKQIKHILSSIRKTGAYLSPAMTDSQIQSLLTTLEQEMYRRINAEGRLELLEKQLKKLAKRALPKSTFGELSKTTGLPKDKLVAPYIRSDRRPHRPQILEYFQLLLPLYFSDEVFSDVQAVLPA
jgi:prophage antirepressor-like protein